MSTIAPLAHIAAASGLGKRYRAGWAVRAVDLRLPPGSITALVGRGGAGKSVLLRMFAGLVRPTTGSIAGLGTVGYVAQGLPLYDTWRVEEMLAFGARVHLGWDRPWARAWLDEGGVPLDRPCGRLPAEQRAWVALGLALAFHPDVLLLDEPTAALDPFAAATLFRAVVGAVAETGAAVLLAPNHTADLLGLADRLLLLEAGRVVLAGNIDDLLSSWGVLDGPAGPLPVPEDAVVAREQHGRRVRVTVRRDAVPADLHPLWSLYPVGLETLLLDHLRGVR